MKADSITNIDGKKVYIYQGVEITKTNSGYEITKFQFLNYFSSEKKKAKTIGTLLNRIFVL